MVTYLTCNTILSPKALYEAMIGLLDERKKCLKQIGFERFIQFPIVELPSTLAYYMIDNFHTPSMELRLQKGSINVTRLKVHEMFGIPIGNRKLEDLELRSYNDPFIREWEDQHRHIGKPTPRAISLQISSTNEADFMFKMNFLTLFESTMSTLENGGRVPTNFLKRIKKDDDISDIDWCGKTHLLEDKQIPSVELFDESFLALGKAIWRKIIRALGSFEEKRTRLRTYTISLKEMCSQSVKRRRKHKRRRHDLSSGRRTDNQEKDEKQSQNDKTGLGMEKTVKDKAKSKPESQSSQKVNRKVNWSKSKSTQVNPEVKVKEI
ncbi:hypothetical protein Tco_1419074 [Tanacetum coccineum]